MNYLLFILCCFVVAFIYYKIGWSLIKLWLALFAVTIIGILIMPLNFDLGIQITSICVIAMVILFFVGIIGIGIASIVAGPFLLLYALIKDVFKK